MKEARGSLTITNVMLEDDGKWQCEAENAKGYIENGRPIQLVVLGMLHLVKYIILLLNHLVALIHYL